MRKLIYILIVVSFFSCRKKDADITEEDEVIIEGAGVLVCNEGNFNWGNASLSWINVNDESIANNVYKSANDNALVGDICQSASYINNDLYVVVNNSGKILVLNKTDFKHITTITGFNSPRYIQKVSNSKAYVTDLYGNSISIVDLGNNDITSEIPTNGWTEEMVIIGDSVYVAGVESGNVYIVNTLTDKIVDSINVGVGATSLQLDEAKNLWVLSGGDVATSANGYIKQIDLTDNSVTKSFPFATGEAPSKLRINRERNKLYYLNSGVYELGITTNSLSSSPIIASGSGQVFYGLGVRPSNGEIYLSDAKDYTQTSTVYVYSNSGEELGSYDAGIISGFFLF